jgi:hypothetical protein
MNPKIAVDITARDKTAVGAKASEKTFASLAKRSETAAKSSGFAQLSKQLDGLSRVSKLSFAFDSMSHSMTSIGEVSARVSGGFAAATEKAGGFGAAGEGAFAGLAAAGGTLIGVIGGIATVTLGAGAAVYALGSKWAAVGASIGRTAQTIGVSVQDLQDARGAEERFGVSPDQTDASMHGIGYTMNQARYGGNKLALGAMTQFGLQMKQGGDGNVDIKQFRYDLADVIARQKNPYTQEAIAAAFGASGSLPALRMGSAALKAQEADYQKSGAALSTGDIQRSTTLNQDAIARKQRFGSIEKTGGMLAESAMGPMGSAWDTGFAKAKQDVDGAIQTAIGAWNKTQHAFQDVPAAAAKIEHAAADLATKGFGTAETAARGFAKEANHATEELQGIWTKNTLGRRNNNPGNLRPANGRGFEHYATMAEGLSHMGRLLRGYQHRHGLNTIDGIVSRYAPPKENNTAAYIAQVSKETGWSPDQKLNLDDPQQLARLEQAMIPIEQGGQHPFTRAQVLASIDPSAAPVSKYGAPSAVQPIDPSAAPVSKYGAPSAVQPSAMPAASGDAGPAAAQSPAPASPPMAPVPDIPAAQAAITVTFKNAPPGTTVKTTGSSGVTIDTTVVRSMDHVG